MDYKENTIDNAIVDIFLYDEKSESIEDLQHINLSYFFLSPFYLSKYSNRSYNYSKETNLDNFFLQNNTLKQKNEFYINNEDEHSEIANSFMQYEKYSDKFISLKTDDFGKAKFKYKINENSQKLKVISFVLSESE
jgi:hypothetical protein